MALSYWLWVAVFLLALYGLILLTCRVVCFFVLPSTPGPRTSLLFIVRDQAPVIEGLVRNVLSFYNTSLPPFELVMIDDFSRDETPDILQRLSRESPFLLILMRDRPLGCKPLETGLRVCRGETVYYLNLTGKVQPRLVIRLVARLLRGEEVRASFEHYALVRRENKKLNQVPGKMAGGF